jgi:histidine ammonia-lyase
VLDLTEQVVAGLLIAARQGVELRERQAPLALTPELAAMQGDLAERLPLIDEDRALDKELVALIDAIRSQAWELYA